MFNNIFKELKEAKYFKEITDFNNLYRNKTFKESSKSRGAFSTQTNICDGVFL